MRELYSKLNDILSKIHYESIWHGFHRYTFALYDDKKVYFQNEVIPYDHRFLGNTSIEYNSEYIAIWNVTNPLSEDFEVLAADLVHEMFHAFQRENNEKRFPSDLLLLNYPDNNENFIVKYCENLLLTKAFASCEIDDKRKNLTKFIAARKYREDLIGDIIKQEYLSETIEGMAEYAGSMALKQISYLKYNSRIKGYINNLQTLDNRFFDTRRMLYYSGALFSILLSELELPFYHSIDKTDTSIFEIASDTASPKKPLVEFNETIMHEMISQYLSNKKQKFDEFLSSPNDEVTRNSFICGYDPMNMIKMGNKVLCSHFIMLKSSEKDEPEFIKGPIIINLKNGTNNEVQSYIKHRTN